MTKNSTSNHYALLTLSNEAGKIVGEFGAIEAAKNDLFRNVVHNYSGYSLYGENIIISFLNLI